MRRPTRFGSRLQPRSRAEVGEEPNSSRPSRRWPEAEFRRLTGLGAHVFAGHPRLVVLTDLDGNEFWVLR